jgi:hypothetical protein
MAVAAASGVPGALSRIAEMEPPYTLPFQQPTSMAMLNNGDHV